MRESKLSTGESCQRKREIERESACVRVCVRACVRVCVCDGRAAKMLKNSPRCVLIIQSG